MEAYTKMPSQRSHAHSQQASEMEDEEESLENDVQDIINRYLHD